MRRCDDPLRPRAIGAALAIRAREAGFSFRAIVADSWYGDQDGFRDELEQAGLPFVLAIKPSPPAAKDPGASAPRGAARALAWNGPDDPGDWHPVTRTFRDGHAEAWHAAEVTLAPWGPDEPARLVVVTTDPATLPRNSTFYLVTNLPRPGGPRQATSPHPAAGLAEITRLYGLRNWAGQGYKQVKDELGWADFQVRSDTAIRRHQVLVHCAFSFCWATWPAGPPPPEDPPAQHATPPRDDPPAQGTAPAQPGHDRGERGPRTAPPPPPEPSWPRALRAVRAWLTPATALRRWWPTWSNAPPPPQLQALIDSVSAGHGLDLYIPT
jgi:hypothetical protein